MVCSLDRIETGEGRSFAVFIPDGGGGKIILELSSAVSLAGCCIKEGDVFEIAFEGDKPCLVTPLPEEKKKRTEKNIGRLSRLFSGEKHKNKTV